MFINTCSSRGVASLRAGLLDDIGKMASQLGASGSGSVGPALFGDSPEPSWSNLRSEAIATPTGLQLEENKRSSTQDVVQFSWSYVQQYRRSVMNYKRRLDRR